VVLAGLSMGGALCATLAADHPDVAGIAAINPYIDPPAESFRDIMHGLLQEGIQVIPTAGGKDIADPGAKEASYSGTPVTPLLSLCEGLDRLAPRLSAITCPLLIVTSRQDHVVPPVSSDVLAGGVSGPVERVWLEESFHVATLDVERTEVERRVVEFAVKVAGL
jgi:carboxylesterase